MSLLQDSSGMFYTRQEHSAQQEIANIDYYTYLYIVIIIKAFEHERCYNFLTIITYNLIL